ncbi:MAG: hypothetical protein QOI61_2383 [Actinomycetota bacterium]|jgi:hypothetical protein
MRTPAREHFYLSGEFAKSTACPPRIHVRFRGARPDDVETEVDLSFRALCRSMKVAFTQGPFKTEERRALHRDGWTDAFDKSERLLSRTAETISN